MKMVKTVSGLFLLAGAISLVFAIIFALTDVYLIASPGGWLKLSLVLAVFSIAVAVSPCCEKPK